MKKAANFEDLLVEGIEDLYDAEKQVAAALPKMLAAASSEELGGALASHLEETQDHISRLEAVFEEISGEPGGRECRPMRALIEDAGRLIGEIEKSPVLDVALIASARKVEHYQIAAYAAACGIAETLGQQEAFSLLHDTLEEEIEAEAALEELAEACLSGDTMAVDVVDEEEIEEEEEAEG
jgi:ferritin-like metal-binding protein YciE